MPLKVLTTKSTSKYITIFDFDEIDNNAVLAIGGGAIIDQAKILAYESGRPCYAIPTTASGAACTSWAVVWHKNHRESVPTGKPILLEIYRCMKIKLPSDVLEATLYDCKAHIQDSLCSIKANEESRAYCQIATQYLKRHACFNHIADLIDAGNFAGRAIEITGTNYLHAISYVLTLDYEIPHGQALKIAMTMPKQYNWNKIIKKAQKYPKFHERTHS